MVMILKAHDPRRIYWANHAFDRLSARCAARRLVAYPVLKTAAQIAAGLDLVPVATSPDAAQRKDAQRLRDLGITTIHLVNNSTFCSQVAAVPVNPAATEAARHLDNFIKNMRQPLPIGKIIVIGLAGLATAGLAPVVWLVTGLWTNIAASKREKAAAEVLKTFIGPKPAPGADNTFYNDVLCSLDQAMIGLSAKEKSAFFARLAKRLGKAIAEDLQGIGALTPPPPPPLDANTLISMLVDPAKYTEAANAIIRDPEVIPADRKVSVIITLDNIHRELIVAAKNSEAVDIAGARDALIKTVANKQLILFRAEVKKENELIVIAEINRRYDNSGTLTLDDLESMMTGAQAAPSDPDSAKLAVGVCHAITDLADAIAREPWEELANALNIVGGNVAALSLLRAKEFTEVGDNGAGGLEDYLTDRGTQFLAELTVESESHRQIAGSLIDQVVKETIALRDHDQARALCDALNAKAALIDAKRDAAGNLEPSLKDFYSLLSKLATLISKLLEVS